MFSLITLNLIFETMYFAEPEACHVVRLAGSKLPRSSYLHPRLWCCRDVQHAELFFNVNARDLNSVLHACAAVPLPIEPAPMP